MSKRRGGVGVATYNNFLYAVGGHDAPASNHCSRLSDCVERWVSALSREGEDGTMELSVQSRESSTGRGRDPRLLLTPPPRPAVMSALSCREELPASTEGLFYGIWHHLLATVLSWNDLWNENSLTKQSIIYAKTHHANNEYINYFKKVL